MNNYDKLICYFENVGEEMEATKHTFYRDDMKFLYNFKEIFKYYTSHKAFPKIKFQTLPNLSNARWNSWAILVILVFILFPARRKTLEKTCEFISLKWAKFWLSDHHFKENDYEELKEILQGYEKAENT